MRYAMVGDPADVTAAQEASRRAARPHDHARGGGDDRGRGAGDRVDGRQRARQRAERGRRGAGHAARPRRPHRLRRAADPRPHRHRHHPHPEPRRPRARLPPQRLRLRPQPRLVRPHPGRDRRQARPAHGLPAGADERQPRDGRPRVLLPAQRRPDPPRGRRPVGALDQRPLRRRDGRRVRPPRLGLLQLRHLRPALHGLRRLGADHAAARREHDLREGRQLADQGPHPRAVRRDLGLDLRAGRRQGPRPRRARGQLPPGRTTRECAASSSRTRSSPRQHAGAGGAEGEGPPLLPARDRGHRP